MRPTGQVAKVVAVLRVDRVIRVHPEQPLPAGVPERFVARCCKIITPGEMEHPGPEFLGNGGGRVARARVDHDHFVHPRADARQARGQRRCVVTHDHAQRELDGLPHRIAVGPLDF